MLQDGSIVDAYPALRGVAKPGDMLDGVVIYDLVPDRDYVLSVQTRHHTTAFANISIMLPNVNPMDFTDPALVEDINTYEFLTSDIVAIKSVSVSLEADPTEICLGESVVLTGNAATSSSAIDFEWNVDPSNNESIEFSPTQSTTVSLTVKNEFECVDVDEIDITVHPIPDSPEIIGFTEILIGEEEVYEIHLPIPNMEYQWEIIGGEILIDDNEEVTILWTDSTAQNLCALAVSELLCSSTESCLTISLMDLDLDDDGYNTPDDCDDSNPDINPGKAEVCDGIDNNCDGQIDECLTFVNYFLDIDQDGYGDPLDTLFACNQPEGTVLNGDDCDDMNSLINPDAEDIPNNDIDENCDGSDLISASNEFSGEHIQVFPNPASEFLFVKGTENINFEIELYDISGQLVLDNIRSSSFSIKSLLNGIYVLKLQNMDSNEFLFLRIIVAK